MQGWNNPDAKSKENQEKLEPESVVAWLRCGWAGMRKQAASGKQGSHDLDTGGKLDDPASKSGRSKADQDKVDEAMEGRINDEEESERQKARKDKYMNAASKLRVDQVIEQTQTNATLDFDYLAYLIISGMHRSRSMCLRLTSIVFHLRCQLALHRRDCAWFGSEYYSSSGVGCA